MNETDTLARLVISDEGGAGRILDELAHRIGVAVCEVMDEIPDDLWLGRMVV